MRLQPSVVACLLLLVGCGGQELPEPTLGQQRAAAVPPRFTDTEVISGLESPTAMAIAPDGRIFVCEQGGSLRVIQDGRLLPEPFLTVNVDDRGERGLLGVAFDPGFPQQPYVYVYYTSPSPTLRNRISRFTASGNRAVPGSEVILLNLDPLSSAVIHNGGALHFGADGKLYVAVGDNSRSENAQSLTSLKGKILRLERNGAIPADNPFVGRTTGMYRAIWALGLRNPFTFAVQPGTGRILINDVGTSRWEEINEGEAGANYGWPDTEGPTSDPDFRAPLHAYRHGDSNSTGCSIAGGTFYNPPRPRFPAAYVGRYFFADYCGGWIRTLDPATGATELFATGLDAPVDLDVGPDGSLYYLDRGEDSVHRIHYTAPVATLLTPVQGTLYRAAEVISFSATAVDAEDGTLPASAFTWRVDFHHDTHLHPFVPATPGVTGGSFTVPDLGEVAANVWYRIHLTVRDSSGTTHSVYRDVHPRKAKLTFATSPPGLRVRLDGQPLPTPAEVEGVVGVLRTLGVVSPQSLDGVTYVFSRWAHGAPARHDVRTPEAATRYTAVFTPATRPDVGPRAESSDAPDFTGPWLKRVDSAVDSRWGTGLPEPSMDGDTLP